MGERREIFVCQKAALPSGRTLSFQYGSFKGIAYNDHGRLKAYVNRCTHMGGPVELTRDGELLRCKWHGADFHPCTGEAIEGQAPAGTFLTPIELMEKGNDVYAIFELADDLVDV